MEPAASLTLERHYQAAPEKVFAAWTDPQLIARWWIPSDGGGRVAAEFDLRVGGRYDIVMHMADGQQHAVGGIYREIVPARRLVFTWAWHSTPERESLVTLRFAPNGAGTQLTLTHEGFADEPARDRHLEGWTRALACLDRDLN